MKLFTGAASIYGEESTFPIQFLGNRIGKDPWEYSFAVKYKDIQRTVKFHSIEDWKEAVLEAFFACGFISGDTVEDIKEIPLS